jgi:hypothetical protein
MPTRASINGAYIATASPWKAGGKAVNSATIAKISQTWLASQTGPIDFAIADRWPFARGPRANRSSTPPP